MIIKNKIISGKPIPKELCGSWWCPKRSTDLDRTYLLVCKQDTPPIKTPRGSYECSAEFRGEVGWTYTDSTTIITGYSDKYDLSCIDFPSYEELEIGLNEIVVHEDGTVEHYEYVE